MANTINWGAIYCASYWGDLSNRNSVPEFPAECSLVEGVCGTQYTFNGGQDFPAIYKLDLGGATGTSTLTFDAYGIPDKWLVIQNDAVILDTGYRGNTNQQATLDAELATRGLPSETVIAPPNGTAQFTVTNSEPVYVYVFAPLAGTDWQFTVSCPT